MNSEQVAPTSTTGYPISLSVFDNMGNEYNVKLSLRQKTTPTNQYDVFLDDVEDKNGNSLFAAKTGATPPYGPGILTSIVSEIGTLSPVANTTTGEIPKLASLLTTVQFNASTGEFEQVGATANDKDINIKFTMTAPAVNPFSTNGIDIDFSKITRYASSGTTSLQSYKGDTNGLGKGRQLGNMDGVKVDAAGKIYGTYDNGDSKLLGQIAVTTFANPSGLEAVGNNMFAQTQNSGEFDGIGQDPTTGGGNLSTGVLEMSNVDLSSEFTQMITTQRGFQANSRIITTSDTMLEELINLKR
jgi:flagellar hook protein FlgE